MMMQGIDNVVKVMPDIDKVLKWNVPYTQHKPRQTSWREASFQVRWDYNAGDPKVCQVKFVFSLLNWYI